MNQPLDCLQPIKPAWAAGNRVIFVCGVVMRLRSTHSVRGVNRAKFLIKILSKKFKRAKSSVAGDADFALALVSKAILLLQKASMESRLDITLRRWVRISWSPCVSPRIYQSGSGKKTGAIRRASTVMNQGATIGFPTANNTAVTWRKGLCGEAGWVW